ncbi:hypothetical protein NUM3379_05200 [Kineococcus sp. NUM-3379]
MTTGPAAPGDPRIPPPGDDGARPSPQQPQEQFPQRFAPQQQFPQQQFPQQQFPQQQFPQQQGAPGPGWQPFPGPHPPPGARQAPRQEPRQERPASPRGLRERLTPRKDRLARAATDAGEGAGSGPADVEALLGALAYHVSVPVEQRLRRRGFALGLLVRRLRRDFDRAVLAGVRLRRWAGDPGNAEVAANWARISRETRGGTAAVALLAPWAAVVVALVVAVADYAYFAGLLADLADLQEGDYLSSAAVMARALALTTPLLVFCVCAPAGALAAAWLRGARPSRRMLGLGIALAVATLGLSALFAAFAEFRFRSESAGVGAAVAPTALLALLLGSLPLLAALVGGLLEAPPAREYRIGRRAHARVQRTGRRLQRAELRRRRAVADAHGRLRTRVASLLSRHLDVPAQIAEHTVLSARARGGMAPLELGEVPAVPEWWAEPGRPEPLRGTAMPLPPAALRALGEAVDALGESSPARLAAAVDDACARTDLPVPAHPGGPVGAAGAPGGPDRRPQVLDLRGGEGVPASGAGSGSGAGGGP